MNSAVRQRCAAFAVAVLASTAAVPATASDVCAAPVAYRLLSATTGGIGGSGLTEGGGIGGTGRALGATTGGATTGGATTGGAGTGGRATGSEGGVGGTGRSTGEGGIGGTGRTTGEGGIGGTGRTNEGGIGGTGIVGTITGFASICVNGLEVHYDQGVPVTSNGVPTTARALAIGQVVAVQASRSARGLHAERIAVLNALEGPVTRVGGNPGQIEVMGAPVAPATAEQRAQTSRLRVGDWVQVSGYAAADGSVLASRIARINPQADASVSGHADASLRRVGGVAVEGKPGDLAPGDLAAGDLTVRGHWDGARLAVRQSNAMAGSQWPARFEQVVLETRVREHAGTVIRTGRADVDAALAGRVEHGNDAQLVAGALIHVTARIDAEGALHPTRIELSDGEQGDQRGGSGGGNGQGNGSDDGSGRAGKGHSGDDPATSEQGGHGDNHSGGVGSDHTDTSSDRSGHNGSGDGVDHPERVEQAERVEKIEQVEKIEKVDDVEKVDRIDTVDRPEKVEKPEKVDLPEKVDRPETVDRPEIVDRPEKVELPEKVDRPDTVERPDRPDNSGPH